MKPDGTGSFAIVDVGGFLGVGKHHVAIPVGQFSAVEACRRHALKNRRHGAAMTPRPGSPFRHSRKTVSQTAVSRAPTYRPRQRSQRNVASKPRQR